MTSRVARHSASPKKDDLAIIWASIAIVFCAQSYLAISGGLHWDEFHHYNIIIKFKNGLLTSPLQTFFVHYLQWVPGLPGDVIDHVRIIRFLMLLCEFGTILAIYGVARAFASRRASALVGLFYITGGFVASRGGFFRSDPQITVLLMSSLWLLTRRPLNPFTIVGSAILCGLAGIISVKTVIYIPAFLGVAWLRIQSADERGKVAARIATSFALSILVFCGLYLWHSGFSSTSSVSSVAKRVSSTVGFFFTNGFFPGWEYFKLQTAHSPHIAILGLLTAWGLTSPQSKPDTRAARALLLMPSFSLLIYQNSYPYFYIFLLPPLLSAMAPTLDRCIGKRNTVPAVTLLVTFWGLAIIIFPSGPQRLALQKQKEFITVAYRLFPNPISYFDISGVLGSYDRALEFYQSRAGRAAYKNRGIPQLRSILSKKEVPLVIANYLPFNAELGNPEASDYWLPQDAAILDTSYIQHWGPIWVAGKNIPAGAKEFGLENLIPGQYTVEGSDVTVNGARYKPGDVLWLDRGLLTISGIRTADVRLRWGDNLEVPTETPPNPFPFVPPLRLANPGVPIPAENSTGLLVQPDASLENAESKQE
ncbi:hypothetical protein [Aliiroseovarius subalbicans]|uniref:ArnT family glycosyltransferase n=1 Tax=Aliiroseovarius subalbicans TaxID=2925840 RepID=UPI001F566803|nr:hypothetical protein [Aliiroseovarius subalbicans]